MRSKFFSDIRIVTITFCYFLVSRISVHADIIATNDVTTDSIPSSLFCVSPTLKGLSSDDASSPNHTLVVAAHSTEDTNQGLCNRYVLKHYWNDRDRRDAEERLIRQQDDSLVLAGYMMKITQGQVPLNMDPMETDAQKELDIEKYRRVEIIGNGKGVFVSEAEGVGLHITPISPDAAFFLKASDNSVGVRITTSIDHIPIPFWH